MRLTEAQAKALGITAQQIREAKLTPPGARVVPQGPRTPPPHAFVQGGEGFEAMTWIRTELDARYPGEIRVTRRGLEFPRVKLRIEIDAWSEWSERYANQPETLDDWNVLKLTASALKSPTRQLEVLQICTAYAQAESQLEDT